MTEIKYRPEPKDYCKVTGSWHVWAVLLREAGGTARVFCQHCLETRHLD